MPRILLGIHQINFSTILAMMYSDGSVEYRDRMSMETFSQDARNEFSTLGQTGFDTVMKKHCESVSKGLRGPTPELCSA